MKWLRTDNKAINLSHVQKIVVRGRIWHLTYTNGEHEEIMFPDSEWAQSEFDKVMDWIMAHKIL